MAKELVGQHERRDSRALNYQSGVNTFAPSTRSWPPHAYARPQSTAAIAKIDTNYDIYGRNTPMGVGLKDLTPCWPS